MSRSLFLLSTASQAFFLSHTPHLADNAVLIITVRTSSEAERIMGHIDKLQWKKINVWYIPKGNELTAYGRLLIIRLKIFRLKWKYHSFDNVYIGSYVNLIHLSVLAEYEGKSRLFLLYDGLQMVINNLDRKREETANVMEFPKFYSTLGFKRPEIRSLTFVTPLPLKVKNSDAVHQIRNTTVLKDKDYDENVIHFVGQPLAAFGIVSTDFYLNCLRRIRKKYPGHEIVYFPHPREEVDVLEKINEIFQVKEQDHVFEEFYLELQKVPGRVISFYSSVLINLFYFRTRSELISIEIPKEQIGVEKYRDHISMVYSYFHQNSNKSFKIVAPEKL